MSRFEEPRRLEKYIIPCDKRLSGMREPVTVPLMSYSLNKYDIEILKFLYRSENPIYQNDVSSMVNISSKVVSKSLYKLEKIGLITREPAVHKKRRTYIIRVDKDKVLGLLEELGELPVTIAEAVASIIEVPCVSCQYINKCYEGGFYDPVACLWLSNYIRSKNENQSQRYKIQANA